MAENSNFESDSESDSEEENDEEESVLSDLTEESLQVLAEVPISRKRTRSEEGSVADSKKSKKSNDSEEIVMTDKKDDKKMVREEEVHSPLHDAEETETSELLTEEQRARAAEIFQDMDGDNSSVDDELLSSDERVTSTPDSAQVPAEASKSQAEAPKDQPQNKGVFSYMQEQFARVTGASAVGVNAADVAAVNATLSNAPFVVFDKFGTKEQLPYQVHFLGDVVDGVLKVQLDDAVEGASVAPRHFDDLAAKAIADATSKGLLELPLVVTNGVTRDLNLPSLNELKAELGVLGKKLATVKSRDDNWIYALQGKNAYHEKFKKILPMEEREKLLKQEINVPQFNEDGTPNGSVQLAN